MAEDEFFKVQDQTECFHDCPTVYDFLKLTDEEIVRWRQVLIKYLPPEWAEGLRQDIFNNLSRCFEGEPAYDLYVNWMCGGVDPQQEDSQTDRMHRLANGTDETSITYL